MLKVVYNTTFFGILYLYICIFIYISLRLVVRQILSMKRQNYNEGDLSKYDTTKIGENSDS